MNEGHCCGADKIFDLKSAEKEYRSYLKKGPKRSTQKLLDSISEFNPSGKTLLDIGGGIGAIAWKFHENGGASTTDVDASHGYLEVASRHAQKMGWEYNSSFLFGDITELNGELSSYDFVTMDKVVCCYPDYKSILSAAMSRCVDILAITFPMGGPIAKSLLAMERLYLWLRRNPFRPYIHPAVEIEKFITDSGFDVVEQTRSFPWRVWVFRRK